jgi:hypothetical protein
MRIAFSKTCSDAKRRIKVARFSPILLRVFSRSRKRAQPQRIGETEPVIGDLAIEGDSLIGM